MVPFCSATMGAGTGVLLLALEGRGIWEVVAGTNYVGAASTRSICVGEAKYYKKSAHKSELTHSTW